MYLLPFFCKYKHIAKLISQKKRKVESKFRIFVIFAVIRFILLFPDKLCCLQKVDLFTKKI